MSDIPQINKIVDDIEADYRNVTATLDVLDRLIELLKMPRVARGELTHSVGVTRAALEHMLQCVVAHVRTQANTKDSAELSYRYAVDVKNSEIKRLELKVADLKVQQVTDASAYKAQLDAKDDKLEAKDNQAAKNNTEYAALIHTLKRDLVDAYGRLSDIEATDDVLVERIAQLRKAERRSVEQSAKIKYLEDRLAEIDEKTSPVRPPIDCMRGNDVAAEKARQTMVNDLVDSYRYRPRTIPLK